MTAVAPPASSRLLAFASDIKLSHSVFALPFALLSATLAAMTPDARWGVGSFVLVVICMVCARTVAMAANRYLDADLDRLNPRTAGRAIPGGLLSEGYVLAMIAFFAAVFMVACTGFGWLYGNWWPALLGLPVLLFLCAYPLIKRFSLLCHYYLGAALALSPVCAWIAFTSNLSLEPLLMAGAVLCWTAGFDVIYATADVEPDRRYGVHSLPSRLGIGRALVISRLTHVVSVALLIGLGLASPRLGGLWWIAIVVVAGLVVLQHRLVRADDLSRVNVAFFTVNGMISLILGAAGIADSLIHA